MRSSIFHAFSFLSLAHASCYTSNGTDRNVLYGKSQENFLPCSTSDEFSHCCRLFEKPGGFPVDVCEGSFCRNTKTKALWRESCSDPTWGSANCLKFCIDEDDPDADSIITECDNGSFCCGEDNNLCCDQKKGKWVVNGALVSTSPYTSSYSTSSSKSSTVSSTKSSTFSRTVTSLVSGTASRSHAASSATSTQTIIASKPRNRTPIIAGSVIGAVGLFSLIIGLVLVLLRRGKTTTGATASELSGVHYQQQREWDQPGPKQVWEMNSTYIAEMEGQSHSQELNGSVTASELNGQEKTTAFPPSPGFNTTENSSLLR